MKPTTYSWPILLAGLLTPNPVFGQGDLTQVHQDFSKDPGWEWKDNRIVAEDPPTIKQDFGWAPSDHLGTGPGEIGGRIWQSRTPAYYAMPLGRPLSFKDAFSFSARIAFLPSGGAGAAYLGFFHHELQGWRVWNSMALRLGGESSGQAAIGVDSMTATWQASGASEGYLHVPADGKPHTIRFSCDPSATQGAWLDPRLRNYLTSKRQSTEQILERARKDEPGLTKEELEKRLVEAHAEGLVYYLQRTGHESVIGTTAWSGYFWGLSDEKQRTRSRDGSEAAEAESLRGGAMTLQLDDMRPFKVFLWKQSQDQPVFMDRFGLFNLQLYHHYIDLYLADLTVNGHKVDLGKDPGWEGRGNRVQFLEEDFQRQDFGYSETNWAGRDIGELGGQFTSAEPIDPLYGYYADDIGTLTLDDPISFSGNVCFVNDSTDAGMHIGFFSAKDLTADLSQRATHLKTATNSLGVLIEGGARSGKHFMPQVTSSKDTFNAKQGLPIRPTKQKHAFKLDYDPKANGGLGSVSLTLDGDTLSMDLSEKQRAEGAVFDRFGVANLRAGGKYVVVYFDDLTYTARRPKHYQPVFHKQEVTKTPYPKGGRAF